MQQVCILPSFLPRGLKTPVPVAHSPLTLAATGSGVSDPFLANTDCMVAAGRAERLRKWEVRRVKSDGRLTSLLMYPVTSPARSNSSGGGSTGVVHGDPSAPTWNLCNRRELLPPSTSGAAEKEVLLLLLPSICQWWHMCHPL